MNSLALAEHRLLVSMFIDAHRPERRYMTRQDFQTDYHTEVEPRLFKSIIGDLRKQQLVKAVPDGATYAVRLHGDAYRAALAKILDTLKANTFEVDWQTKRILTDREESNDKDLIPCSNGWMLAICEKDTAKATQVPHTAGPPMEVAGRDINHFHGAVHGHGINQPVGGGDNGWTRWGAIFGGLAVIVAVGAVIAAWYFWRYPHP